MDHGFDAVLTGKALFDAVGQFVCFLECHSVRHFQVQRHHPAAGTVVMDHQVVHAENIFVVHYRCGYVFYKILVSIMEPKPEIRMKTATPSPSQASILI